MTTTDSMFHKIFQSLRMSHTSGVTRKEYALICIYAFVPLNFGITSLSHSYQNTIAQYKTQ